MNDMNTMNENNFHDAKHAIDFIIQLFRTYLVERDFPRLISMLHHDVSWIGTGAHEVCHNLDEALALLEQEQSSWDGHFKITDQWYNAMPMANGWWTVFGGLTLLEDAPNTFLMKMNSRFSMTCIPDGDGFKLYHAHFSVPNVAQSKDEFLHKSMAHDYNLLLEEKLLERTQMLNEKTSQLETLANNIRGGIEICNSDEDYTILYMSDGFLELTGYTANEIHDLLADRHISLVHPEDADVLRSRILGQTANSTTFSLEYRIVRKDGSVIWVLDNGIMIPQDNAPPHFQCILTDITVQKGHEDELRISQKRYELAMQASNITMFEYNIVTRQLILYNNVSNMYGVPNIVDDGMETFIRTGIIEPCSAGVYREMYRKIHAGEASASCYVKTKDSGGTIHDFELSLTTIYDSNKKPVYAIGIRKNIAQMRQLQRENEFGKTLASAKHFTCEADITNDIMLSMDDTWSSLLGISPSTPFSQALTLVCRRLVAPEHQEMMLSIINKENITKSFEAGNCLITFEYKKLLNIRNTLGIFGAEEYVWYEATVNIIRDDSTGSINIRYYTDDINEQKVKEQRAIDEQRLYESMLSRTSTIYEFNISKNLFISGHESWSKLFGINQTNNYSEMMTALLDKAIHPDDAETFRSCYLRKNMYETYKNGQTQVCCDYRRPSESGDFIWVRCTSHLFEDPTNGDIRGYSYIEDIDSQKKSELALRYKAEHDSLTGFYNKSITEKLISDFLGTADAKLHKHAFIMIDIDYFKSINDTFGHIFGDAVLSQTSSKIATLLRDDDILGRVGGDEFVVFMKNIYDIRVAMIKAEEIRTLLSEHYTQRGKSYNISASIGVATYPLHGKSYDDLYIHSDSALYVSKKNGRNCVSLYNSVMTLVETDKEFNPLGMLELRTFEDNISEYIFRILYESTDKEASINAVLALVGKHLNVSRAYIFEDTPDGLYTSNTYEWCNDHIPSYIDNLQQVRYENLDAYKSCFNDDGILYVPDIGLATEGMKRIMAPQNIKSMLQFAIRKDSRMVGFIGFDQCDCPRAPSRKELSDCYNISQILGVFITEMRVQRQSKAMEEMAMSIVNALDSYAYICDPADHTLLFINDSTMELSPAARVGQKCYTAFWARDTACEICPMTLLAQGLQSKYTMEVNNTNLNVWSRATASWIDWQGGRRVCLVDSVDITCYKDANQ